MLSKTLCSPVLGCIAENVVIPVTCCRTSSEWLAVHWRAVKWQLSDKHDTPLLFQLVKLNQCNDASFRADLILSNDVFWSQNHRMAWVEKHHNPHPVPTPCYVQGHQPADQAAQSHIQPGLECLQGWGIHSLLGQPVQCVTTLWVKGWLWRIFSVFLIFHLLCSLYVLRVLKHLFLLSANDWCVRVC